MKYLTKSKRYIHLILLFVIFSLGGCISSPSTTEDKQAFNGAKLNNKLTLEGKTLALPENWNFIQNPNKEGTLFNFRSTEEIEGGLECIIFEYDIDIEKVKVFYKDYVFQSEKRVKVDSIQSAKFGTVTSYSGYANKRNLYTLLLSDGNDVTFLHFSSSDDVKLTTEEAMMILNTYSVDERDWISVREKKGAPLFTSVDNTWFWYNDFKDGYFIAKDVEKEDMIAGLWSLTALEIEELKNREDFDIIPFISYFRIRNENIPCTIYGQKKKSNNSNLYILFELDSVQYCFNLVQDSIEEDLDPRTLLEKQVIQDLFDYYLLFPEGIQ